MMVQLKEQIELNWIANFSATECGFFVGAGAVGDKGFALIVFAKQKVMASEQHYIYRLGITGSWS